jgi:hypothetical protein
MREKWCDYLTLIAMILDTLAICVNFVKALAFETWRLMLAETVNIASFCLVLYVIYLVLRRFRQERIRAVTEALTEKEHRAPSP